MNTLFARRTPDCRQNPQPGTPWITLRTEAVDISYDVLFISQIRLGKMFTKNQLSVHI